MVSLNKKWVIQRPNEQHVQHLQEQLKLSPIAAKILVTRGCQTVEQAQKILTIDENALHDPFLLHHMDKAVARIQQALEVGEKILIYGDYDADGITSTTVMLHTLLDLGADVDFVIPNRFTHGYGPNEQLFREAHARGVQLIITVDNGISGIEPIRVARELGMDVIVTDHHEAGETLPPADIIIHPRVPEGHYPCAELAGVGVAFKVAHALYGEVPTHLYELVAIGTIADLVPLVDENRYIVQQGIKYLRQSQSPWVQAFCKVASATQSEINEETIGFYFGPRLNAIGRLGDAMPGVHFMMSEDHETAKELAELLNAKNTERKQIVSTITEEAEAMIDADNKLKDAHVLVVAQEGWNPGVVGIVASRLVEKYYRPTIVLSLDTEKGTAKGSARSIEGFHLFNELAKNRDILPHFGGHPMAAGMTLAMEHVELLQERLNEQARGCLTAEQLIPQLTIDVPVELSEVTVEAIEEIQQLGPFGVDFPKPVFALEQVKVSAMRKIGAGENHLKLELDDGYCTIDAVGFNKGYLFNEISYGVALSFVGDLQINEWQNRKKPQFMVQDVQSKEWQLFDLRGKKQISNIPQEETLFVVFDDQLVPYFEQQLQVSVTLAEHVEREQKSYVAVLDLPPSEESFTKLLQALQPQRIYAHFYTATSHYFSGMPTRQHFSWYYSFLKKRPGFSLQQHIEPLAKHIGLNVDVINFMTKVFFELGFVTIENGLTTVVEDAPKQALETAHVYKVRSAQIQLEQKLLYATYSELKQWLDSQMTQVDS
ncbi:single-stranded-DNA-specific exonuclease RecJ [Metasolibacillus meyeri]|uniref:Single-stranded-DNA-specific exonuclease RecJ n=1 Tax=Metasolibacillus meyeri TaxID=1071052 RepID=A0AAW9NP57_9BACL|nr:single-stranded-DNA-specific exonuclease RecJ [Metasolibacillus meyeri]MEC1178311.1 single-stranded-DNA-specific exonuclease RecJ [Metasolibacillus meyeri]